MQLAQKNCTRLIYTYNYLKWSSLT